ncbi:hypothetical protein SAMN05216353_102196 [Halobacillus alkaliphilus]|uniref:Glycosyltransferase 2-like domain-containing protein n=1 Tax=Halobacillus alkaliphilus TaxID=396056 RepID=A0A1I2K0S4_9BACI|nr:glycosyltransferase [Halobacillus alkaliphilus]SFF58691.1 hypothetical protein SAMN05216353_102196 [Halobacillus alkaliphilus]
MYHPLVSIIIPVYNGSNYLKESIESALKQSYDNVEIIVVNDGSNDNGATEEIALSFGEKIRYFSKENGGVSTALNFGILKMNGELFSWLSHDDLYSPDKIKSQIHQINSKNFNPTKTIISCKTGLINSSGDPISRPNQFQSGLYSGKDMFKYLCSGKSLGGCSLLIPKNALEDLNGFNEDYKFIQDWACWLQLALKGNDFYLYERELVKSRVHGNQDTIRLANLQPVEVNKYLISLLQQIRTEVIEKNYYLKTILFYYCTTKKDTVLRRTYILELKNNNEFTTFEKSKYLVFLVRGQFIMLLKSMNRILKSKFHRGIK